MKMTVNLKIHAVAICLGVFAVSTSANAAQCPASPTLKIDKHTLDFNEHVPICVYSGGTFEIRLIPISNYTLNHEDVTVKEKAGPTPISKESVSNQGVMTVRVGNLTVGEEYGYEITVKDVGVLDPRVRIIPSYLALNPEYGNIENYLLEEYSMSLSGLVEIAQPLRKEYGMTIADILEIVRSPNSEK